MTPISALTMYDLPEIRSATDGWWAIVARHLEKAGIADVPERLSRGRPPETYWRHPALLLTQTCGYPLTHAFEGTLTAIAAPDYAAPGCGGGQYRSAFVVHETDTKTSLQEYLGATVAANGPDSQSGCNVLRAAVAPLARDGRFFGDTRWTGSHRASLADVRGRTAAIAAIDGVTLELLKRNAPAETQDLRILAWSRPTPALPYAVRADVSEDLRARLLEGLLQAVADPHGRSVRETLLIAGMNAIDDKSYRIMPAMRTEAERLGYPALA